MRQAAITLAVVGTVAAVAVLGLSGSESATTMFETNPDIDIFHNYLATHGKSYATQEEFSLRYSIFKRNLALVRGHNANAIGKTYNLALNKFADYTPQEYRKMLGYKKNSQAANGPVFEADSNTEIPASIDWRKEGKVAPVKDQGQCGSCWAFSTVGSLESRDAIKTGKLVQYSEQQLVDCDTNDGNQGCDGGDMYTAMLYTKSNPLETEAEYPYTAEDGSCAYKKSEGVSSNTGATQVKANSSASLKAALAQGPVSVAIEADTETFQFYSGGILNSADCGDQLDHGVLAVGYGSEAGQEYYIVKNSWGADWGEEGFVRIAIQSGEGICGIQMQPVFPTV